MSQSAAGVLAAIVDAARSQGLSRKALAQRAGVRAETVSRIAARGTCDFTTLGRLADAAGLSLGLEHSAPTSGGRLRDLVLQKRALIRTLAKAHGARTLALFGSVARAEERPASDIDFMAELEPGRSLLDLIGLAQDLQEALGRKVEVVTRAGMKPRVLAEADRDAVRIV